MGQDISTSAYVENPYLTPSLGLQLTITVQQMYLSTAVIWTLVALIPHSVEPLVKTICLTTHVYILQKLKLNKKLLREMSGHLPRNT